MSGSVKQGQQATFTVDAFPGKTFPASITRVDLGSNLSAQTTTTTTTTAQVVSYGATLSVGNADQQLRPGMTATADIVTNARNNVLLVPNAALRFKPTETHADRRCERRHHRRARAPAARRGGGGAERTATIGAGAKQTVYIKGEDGKPKPVEITTGVTNGTVTEVIGGGLKPGDQVITGQLSGDGAKSGGGQQRRSGARRRGRGAGGGQRSGQ